MKRIDTISSSEEGNLRQQLQAEGKRMWMKGGGGGTSLDGSAVKYIYVHSLLGLPLVDIDKLKASGKKKEVGRGQFEMIQPTLRA